MDVEYEERQRAMTMGCILALLALALPRVLMCFVLLLTGWFGRAFETHVWPLLGFLFMPYTTLAYMAAMLNNDRVLSGRWLALFIVAVLFDAGHCGGSRLAWRRRKHSPAA
jgi:hypothetical protein